MCRLNKYVLLLFLFFSVLLNAQFDRLQNYNVKDGLASSEIYRLMQDSKGYIWCCGDMGVSRFNGYDFKNFTSEDGLPDNTVFGVYEDKKGRTWFHPYSSRLAFLKDSKITALSCNDTLEKLLKHNFITTIYVDAKDTVWLGTTNNFIIKINPGWKTSDVKVINFPDGKYFFYVETGLIYGGNNPETCSITAYTKNLKKIFSIDPQIHDEKKNLSRKKGYLRFYMIRLSDQTYLASINEHLIKFNTQGIIKQIKERSIIINLLEDNDRSIIVGTYAGMAFFSNDLIKKRTIQQLDNKIITSSCLDKENGLWLSTEGHGVFYIPNRNFLYYTAQNGLPESKITCIGLHNNNMAIGHLDGSASILYEDSVGKIYNDTKINTYAQAGRLTSILGLNEKTIVTSMRSVYYLKDKELVVVPEFSNIAYKKFIKSNDGNILGINFRVLSKYDLKNHFKQTDSIILTIRTDNLFEDSKNKIWLSGVKGVYTYQNKKLNYLGDTEPLFSIRASDIKETIDGSIWVATRGGGVIVKKGNKIKQFTEKQGLAGNMCRSLFVDSNSIWVGTNKGLSRITINGTDNYSIENFYAKNGLLTNEVNTILKFNKKLWLAHNEGISVFDVNSIKSNKNPPPIYILQTFVNDSLCNVKDLEELEHDRNRLTINYIGISYKDAGHVEYRYKMLGIDSNWVYTNYTTVSYHTIPPGTYRFIVSAKNNDGYWSTLPATIVIKILQPWWKNWIFISFVVIVIGLLVGFLFKHRLSTIKQKERLKAIQQTKLSNAELKALRAQMNPHFVFNAINSVQYFITNNDPVSSQKYLSKFAKLIRYVVDNSKPLAIPLSKELEALNLYLDLEWLRFENKFEYSIDVNKNVDVEGVQIPSMLIQPYVENAIWHGLMHKNSKGKIKIEISRYENVLFCVIEDNGIGRKRSQEIIKEKNNEFHKSVGLSITHERLEVINQQHNTKLTVNVIDLEDEEGNGIGTRVELNLPFY